MVGESTMKYFLIGLMLACAILIFFLPPILQDPAYHAFADHRTIFGIANFMDVVSNIPFLLVGLYGMYVIARGIKVLDREETIIWLVFSVGMFFIGVGSTYYHLNPTDNTLIWDRLPMTLAFMSLFSFVIMDRFSLFYGRMLYPVLMLGGALSIGFWVFRGDLRPYVLVQFMPMLIIPLACWLLPGHFDKTKFIYKALIWYALSKAYEYFDVQVYDFTHHVISGHSIKHFCAAMGALALVVYFKKKRVVNKLKPS